MFRRRFLEEDEAAELRVPFRQPPQEVLDVFVDQRGSDSVQACLDSYFEASKQRRRRIKCVILRDVDRIVLTHLATKLNQYYRNDDIIRVHLANLNEDSLRIICDYIKNAPNCLRGLHSLDIHAGDQILDDVIRSRYQRYVDAICRAFNVYLVSRYDYGSITTQVSPSADALMGHTYVRSLNIYTLPDSFEYLVLGNVAPFRIQVNDPNVALMLQPCFLKEPSQDLEAKIQFRQPAFILSALDVVEEILETFPGKGMVQVFGMDRMEIDAMGRETLTDLEIDPMLLDSFTSISNKIVRLDLSAVSVTMVPDGDFSNVKPNHSVLELTLFAWCDNDPGSLVAFFPSLNSLYLEVFEEPKPFALPPNLREVLWNLEGIEVMPSSEWFLSLKEEFQRSTALKSFAIWVNDMYETSSMKPFFECLTFAKHLRSLNLMVHFRTPSATLTVELLEALRANEYLYKLPTTIFSLPECKSVKREVDFWLAFNRKHRGCWRTMPVSPTFFPVALEHLMRGEDPEFAAGMVFSVLRWPAGHRLVEHL